MESAWVAARVGEFGWFSCMLTAPSLCGANLRPAVTPPSRPVLRWFGGKWKLAKHIISELPPHDTYVEPFSGAASVLFQKSRSHVEVLNDLNGRLVNVFRVLRDDEQAARLSRMLSLTPFSNAEFYAALEPSDDPVEDARRMIILGHQAHGETTVSGGKRSGWKRKVACRFNSSATLWTDLPDQIFAWADRLRGVFIENGDALAVIRQWDSRDAVFYVDPPYLHSTRNCTDGYAHELSDLEHEVLLSVLNTVKGRVVLSGYSSPLYEKHLRGWRQVELDTLASSGVSRTELLWVK